MQTLPCERKNGHRRLIKTSPWVTVLAAHLSLAAGPPHCYCACAQEARNPRGPHTSRHTEIPGTQPQRAPTPRQRKAGCGKSSTPPTPIWWAPSRMTLITKYKRSAFKRRAAGCWKAELSLVLKGSHLKTSFIPHTFLLSLAHLTAISGHRRQQRHSSTQRIWFRGWAHCHPPFPRSPGFHEPPTLLRGDISTWCWRSQSRGRRQAKKGSQPQSRQQGFCSRGGTGCSLLCANKIQSCGP